MKDWLTEWYNDQFEKIDLTPSSNVWENISQTMEDWPKHWYSSNVTDIGTKPRPSTWDQVHESLAHDRKLRLANRLPYAAASLMLFFLLIIPFNIEDSLMTVEYDQIAKSERGDVPNGVANRSNEDLLSSISGKATQEQTSISTKAASVQNQNVFSETEEELIDIINKLEQIDLSFDETTKDQLFIAESEFAIKNLPVLISDLNQDEQSSGIITDRRISQKGNWLSLGVAPQLSLLNNPLSQKTINSNSESLEWKPSMTYVVSAGHQFNNRNGVKVAMLFNNQKSLQTTSNSIERNISLNYFSVGAMYTSSWPIAESRKLTFNTEVGLMAGISTNTNVRFNKERIEYLEQGYGKFDAGAILGASISTKLSDHWSLNTGLTSQVGLLNIFRGTDVIPPDYFRTTTQSLGMNVGIVRNF